MSPLNHIAVTPESETGSKSSWFDIAPHHLSLNTPSLPPAQIIHVTRHSSLRGTQGRLTSGEGGPANSGRGSASKVKRGEKVHARLSQRVWCPDRGVVSGPAHARGRPSGVCVSPSVSSRYASRYLRKPFMLIDLSTLTNREAAGIPGIASHM
ncbi:hypothetical protein J6590_103089 [Homalodisca vitripennis]|nr:hypothetical protein J6590_103089 [Homalodisca vitripennis]